MKAINYKMKILKRFFILPEEAPENCSYPERVLRLQKQSQIGQKSNINLQ